MSSTVFRYGWPPWCFISPQPLMECLKCKLFYLSPFFLYTSCISFITSILWVVVFLPATKTKLLELYMRYILFFLLTIPLYKNICIIKSQMAIFLLVRYRTTLRPFYIFMICLHCFAFFNYIDRQWWLVDAILFSIRLIICWLFGFCVWRMRSWNSEISGFVAAEIRAVRMDHINEWKIWKHSDVL